MFGEPTVSCFEDVWGFADLSDIISSIDDPPCFSSFRLNSPDGSWNMAGAKKRLQLHPETPDGWHGA